MSVDWMAWTTGTAVFVAAALIFLVALVVIAVRWPSTPRKGFLPIETARGDRIYISLLGTGLIMILSLAFTDMPVIVGLAVAAVAWIAPVLRWG